MGQNVFTKNIPCSKKIRQVFIDNAIIMCIVHLVDKSRDVFTKNVPCSKKKIRQVFIDNSMIICIVYLVDKSRDGSIQNRTVTNISPARKNADSKLEFYLSPMWNSTAPIKLVIVNINNFIKLCTCILCNEGQLRYIVIAIRVLVS